MHPLQKAIKVAGGQSELARKINEFKKIHGYSSNLKQQHVWKWLNHKSGVPTVPPEYCVAIESITGVACYELRPDIYLGTFSNTEKTLQTEKNQEVYT